MLAIIPAKKQSKRLPNKNIKLLAGKPLIAYTIETALKSKLISRVIVTTDCSKIAKISKKYGAEVPFLRPKKLTTQKSGKLEVCKHVVNFLSKKEGANIFSFIVLQPTSPLRLTKDIDKAIKIFRKNKADSVVSFCKAKSLEWHRYIRNDGSFHTIRRKNSINNPANKINYLMNGSIYIFRTSFMNKNTTYNKKSFSYIMPRERSIDIDDIDDFESAKYLISKKIKK